MPSFATVALRGTILLGLTALTTFVPAFAGGGGGTYIAVGDSAAYGYMDSTLTPPGGSGYAGYTQPYTDFLSAQAGAPVTLLNLGIVGETSQTLLYDSTGNSELNSNYSAVTPETQFALLSTNLTPDVTHITVQIGANDILGLATNPAFFYGTTTDRQALLTTTLATIATNYNTLLTQISTLAPAADVQVLDYYNPYAALPASTLSQPYNDYLRTVSGPLIGSLNSVIAQEAALHNDQLVDLAAPFAGHESTLTLSSEYIDYDGTFLPNDHPTAAGYAVITQQLEAAAVPEASTALSGGLLLMLGLGSLAVAARKKRQAKKALKAIG